MADDGGGSKNSNGQVERLPDLSECHGRDKHRHSTYPIEVSDRWRHALAAGSEDLEAQYEKFRPGLYSSSCGASYYFLGVVSAHETQCEALDSRWAAARLVRHAAPTPPPPHSPDNRYKLRPISFQWSAGGSGKLHAIR